MTSTALVVSEPPVTVLEPVPTASFEAVAKRTGRDGRTILTDRICQKRVTKRTKVYDRKCPGLYASIIPAGTTTLNFKFTDPATGKQRSTVIGPHNPETFTVEDARSKVYGLKAIDPAALVEQLRQTTAATGKHGKTVAEIIELRIDWMKHIAELSNDILDGKFGKPSRSNARHMRRAVSELYSWASEAGRNLVPENCRPTYNLPKLPKEPPRKRVLSEDEIRTLWHGLDRNDLPWDRRTRLAIKFELVTMLRSAELIGAHRDELIDLDGTEPVFRVPAKRVKKRRVIGQPGSLRNLESWLASVLALEPAEAGPRSH